MSICHRISGYKPLTFTRELPANHLSVGGRVVPVWSHYWGQKQSPYTTSTCVRSEKKNFATSQIFGKLHKKLKFLNEPWVTSLHQKIRRLFVAKFFGAFQLATSACNWARSDSLSAHELLSLLRQPNLQGCLQLLWLPSCLYDSCHVQRYGCN